jgi:hypothetical protein
MKDIKLNTTYKKIQYPISWVMFIMFGMVWAWLVAIGLTSYGKNTEYNKEKKKGILNLTYQKFIYVYGLIFTYLFLTSIILNLFGLF